MTKFALEINFMKKALVIAALGLFAVACGETTANVQEIGNVNDVVESKDLKKELEEKLKAMMPLDKENAVLLSMKPTKEDVAYLFQEESDVELVTSYIDRTYARLPKTGVLVGEKRTEILVYERNTDVLKTERDENFPDQYYDMADKFNRSRVIYAVEFAEPGEVYGRLPMNIFVYSNGRWVFFPRVYRAFVNKPMPS